MGIDGATSARRTAKASPREILLSIDYVARRLGLFVLVIWLATTLNFLVPRVPEITAELGRQNQPAARQEANNAGSEPADPHADYYTQKFRLDRPLLEQYLSYMADMARLDLNYSRAHYPKTVREIIGQALPWTMGLLGVSTLLAFGLGSLLGILLAWPRASSWLKYLTAPLLTLSAIPFYLLGLILLYVFAFVLGWLPGYGGYPILMLPAWGWSFILGLLRHAILPAAAIVLSALGSWALGMRGMMVTAVGEDYMLLAEAKGLRGRTLLFRYAARNAILPQVTALALSMGNVMAGAVLVEIVFSYPGIGTVLKEAILFRDYFLLQGIIFTIVVAIALTTLVLDLALPLLDPRIGYERE